MRYWALDIIAITAHIVPQLAYVGTLQYRRVKICFYMNQRMRYHWRHQMETFSTLLAICAGNSPASGEFPGRRPVTRSFDVFFDLRLNKWLRKQSRGWLFETPLRTHYDVIVMYFHLYSLVHWECLWGAIDGSWCTWYQLMHRNRSIKAPTPPPPPPTPPPLTEPPPPPPPHTHTNTLTS